MKLHELNDAFQKTKTTGVIGEKLASETIAVFKKIDFVLAEFAELQKDEAMLVRLAESTGGNEMEYILGIAQILAEAKAKAEALG